MLQRALFSALLLLALMAGSCAHKEKPETVWSGLVIAKNVADPTPIPPELNQIEVTLKNLFGYNQFQVIGQSRKTLKAGEEKWDASSTYFSLHVDSKAAERNSYLLNLQLFQQKKLLLETEAKLSKSRPLLIRGPQVGAGQLVLLVAIE